MSRFNNKKVPEMTTNKSGVKAYKMSPVEMLMTQVLSTFFTEKYYCDNTEEIKANIRNCIEIDPKFVANLAIYARTVMNMRTISHVMMAELAHHVESKPYAKEAIIHTVVRPDDMTETLTYYLNEFGKPIPNSMKKGLSTALNNFNEFTISKYNRKGNGRLTFKDLIMLCHPKHSELIKKILSDDLKVAETWETKLSKEGNTSESWEYLINNNKLGYMAALRNMRNILQSNPNAKTVDKLYALLEDKEKVKKSKLLPFRFYTAYNELSNSHYTSSRTFDVLETAIEHSCENIEKIKGKTLIAVDVSGSMSWDGGRYRHSDKTITKVLPVEIASVMAAIAHKICEDAIVVAFDTSCYKKNLSTKNGIIANAKSIKCDGGGTNISLPIEYILRIKIKVDRIIMLSDNEINSGFDNGRFIRGSETLCQRLLNDYRNTVNKDVWFHGIDIEGYGTQQFKGNKVNIISGWSEKVLSFINLTETGTTTLKDTISTYHFK